MPALSYIEKFFDLASSFIDYEDLLRANATYFASELYDTRRPTDPSRKSGVGPSCSKCFGYTDEIKTSWLVSQYGMFQDYKDGKFSKIKDLQYLATHIFRFIGYVLYTKGYSCLSLYIPGKKYDIYTPYSEYDDSICSDL